MQRWFLSYHSPDQTLAERLKSALEQRDRDFRVFFAPTSLRAGGLWSSQLAAEIAEATVFVLLVGARGVGRWQVLEYDEALDRQVQEPNFPVVLVLLEGQQAPGLPFLRRLHWVVTPDPASERSVAQLIDVAAGSGVRPGDLWRYTAPYRGLAAMEEKDAAYFFGRDDETVEVIRALEAASDKLPLLLGNSGVGKSSLAKAGVLAALARQGWAEHMADAAAWPSVFGESRRWCFLSMKPGTEPLRALVEPFLRTWQLDPTGTLWVERQGEWATALGTGRLYLRDLLDATSRRFEELGQQPPSTFFLYIDQGEELYVRAEERQHRAFSELVARGLGDPRLRALMSLRADFAGALQNDEPLYAVHRQINVPPMREGALREVVSRPALVLSARFDSRSLAAEIAHRAAEDSVKDAGALPLLSYLLEDMWAQMVQRGDGVLRLPPQAIDLGGVLKARADAFLASHPEAEAALQHLLTLKLANVREDGEPTRRRAPRSEFTMVEWKLVTELVDHPNRLLVTVTPESGEPYAEVAHEALFRRWDRLREWIAKEREFLAWRSDLQAARRRWQGAPAAARDGALLMGFALAQARLWRSRRGQGLAQLDNEFIDLSVKAARRRTVRAQALVGGLALCLVSGVLAWWHEPWLKERYFWLANIRGYVLTAESVLALRPQQPFLDCARDDLCPEMVVVPAGSFVMGSREGEGEMEERPQRRVTFAAPFAVSRFEVTFAQWDTCVAGGGCPQVDSVWGRGRQPVINVGWYEAKQFGEWLSRITSRPYRLLSEAEWEYAARAGTTTRYSFGDAEAGLANHAWYDKNSDGKTHPVGEKKPNAFGIYDMHGNVFEWVEDAWHPDYTGNPPGDGSMWHGADESARVLRGGSWYNFSDILRSAFRHFERPDYRVSIVGFRVARSLK
jgi:formylglycine-generating enzyme required for sulfatase activity